MTLATVIERHLSDFHPMFDPPLTAANTIYMELSAASEFGRGLGPADLDAAVFARIDAAGAIAGVGGYLENRSVYKDTEHFRGDAERCIHIGVDVFMPAGTPLHAPLAGTVHSFANRTTPGDYGPVIILRHELDGIEFHTLYGHLTEESLDALEAGMPVAAGARIAAIGPRPINGDWTPHLHFQLVRDMQGIRGDYPGVVRPADLDFYRDNCPDPMPLLVA